MKKLIIFVFIFLITPYFGSSFNFTNFNFEASLENMIDYYESMWRVKLFAWGDIMLSRYIGYLDEKEDYNRIFSWDNYNPVKDYKDCQKWNCLLFFNLESPFSETDNNQADSTFSFQANKKSINTINQLQQDNEMLLSLANNHIYNAGYEWLRTTQDLLEENNIMWVGAGSSHNEARRIKEITKNNIDLCFQAYSYDWKQLYYGNNNHLVWNEINIEDIQEDLDKMESKGCDANIISLHWWREYKIEPTNTQRQQAREIIDSWADLILGHHSHVPGSIEKYNWKYIFYSFGNFIFDQDWWRQNYGQNHPQYDTIKDKKESLWSVPTYIALNAVLDIRKIGGEVDIKVEKLKTVRSEDWILERNDRETGTNILRRIKEF